MTPYYNTFNEAWINLLDECLVYGDEVSPRGPQTKEIINSSVSFLTESSILTVPERKLSYDFMFAEAWWILEGRNDVETLTKFAPSYGKFSDDGSTLSGAYGPRIIDQFSYALRVLCHDPNSRQAVINIWRDRPGPSKDIACTLSIQFLIRDKRLHTIVNMRSNDLWLGMPYDVFTIAMIASTMVLEFNSRNAMKIELGKTYHNAASRHIYIKDSDKALSVVRSMLFDQNQLAAIVPYRIGANFECMRADALRELLKRRIHIDDLKLTPFLVNRHPWISYK